MTAVSARIDNALTNLEQRENVRILYACESGSRAWGFPSKDSDYDVRFIYHRPAERYLRLNRPRDVLECPIVDDLDVNGWDIYKACHLLRKTNPPLLEWLSSPIVYRESSEAASLMRGLVQKHFSARACAEHYLSMAGGNFKDYINGRDRVKSKRYLYILRSVFCAQWIAQSGTMPPTRFGDVLDGVEVALELRAAVDNLIASKLDERETAEISPLSILNEFIAQQLRTLPAAVSNLPSQPFPTDELDGLMASLLL